MKNRVLLENYYLPGDLERQIGAFVDYYNHKRYHESLNNVTPADVYFGRDKATIRERKKIKKLTIPLSCIAAQYPAGQRKTPLATSKTSCIINHTNEPEPPILKPL